MNLYFIIRLQNWGGCQECKKLFLLPAREDVWVGAFADMSTVDKALSLLEHFGSTTPELGLVAIAQLSGFDKATTHRLLVALAKRGFVDQDRETKRYRLGPALIRYAQIRETYFPLVTTARQIVDELSATTGETVHVSQLSSGVLATAYVSESSKVIRVGVAVGEKLPFSCTASGLAVLAFAPEAVREAVATAPLVAVTKHSITSRVELNRQLAEVRKHGYAVGDQGFEDGVFSVAAPLLNRENEAFGAISITSPTARIGPDTPAIHGAAACRAASRITAALGLHTGERQ